MYSLLHQIKRIFLKLFYEQAKMPHTVMEICLGSPEAFESQNLNYRCVMYLHMTTLLLMVFITGKLTINNYPE